MTDASMMALAIEEARLGMEEGGEPVGAVVVRDGKVLGSGRNRLHQTGDPTAHAEMEAYRDAAHRLAALGGTRPPEAVLHGATVFTTAMPCEMCAGAMLRFAAERVVVAETLTYRPAGTRALLERQGIAVEILQEPAMTGLIAAYLQQHPDRRDAFERSDDRPPL